MAEDKEQNFAELLEGASELEVRELCIEAIRRIRRKGDRASTIVLDPVTLQDELAPLLRERSGLDKKELVKLDGYLGKPWATPLLQFLIWLERSGLAFLYSYQPGVVVEKFRLLPAGLTFFDAVSDEHPLVPGWLVRLQRRCSAIGNDAVDLLADAHACFEHGLLRPAVALLGVAVETVVLDVQDAMITQHQIALQPANASKAATRVTAVRSGLAARFPGNSGAALEAIGAARRACDFADHLRTRRNDASHPTARFPFDDRQEVEELLVSAARCLPGLLAVK